MKRISLLRFFATPIALFLAGPTTSSIGWACSLSIRPTSVGSSFKVKVAGYDGPVKGLLLKLATSRGYRPAVTDDRGIAYFRSVPAGRHHLEADHDNGFGAEVNVDPNGPADIIVPMRWPSVEPIHVRSASGMIRAPDAFPGQLQQRELSLELMEGVSGQVLSSINATNLGAFDFGKLAPGLYFIRVKPYTAFHQEIGGLISIAVDPSAPERASKLDLNLSWTSCGLMYTDQIQCPQPELHVKSLQGHATGSMGRAPHRAEVTLLDATQTQVVHVSTDSDGNFSFPGPLVGTFELRIDGGGFTPVHTPLYVEPSAEASSLEIQAAYGIGCSTVRAK